MFVVPDQRVEFVPNIGIVLGSRSALVIDTAMGAATESGSSPRHGASAGTASCC